MPPQTSKQARWFSEHILPHEPSLRAWLRKKFPGSDGIDDAIHDAYLKLLKLSQGKEIRAPKALLYRTASNLLIDHLKSHKVSRKIPYEEEEGPVVLDGRQSIPETVSRKQELEILRAAIQSLPAQCREIMTLHEIYGMAQKDIAKQLGVSPSLVSNQVSIGLRKCMAFVKQYRKKGWDFQ